jgi:hypothetical protein
MAAAKRGCQLSLGLPLQLGQALLSLTDVGLGELVVNALYLRRASARPGAHAGDGSSRDEQAQLGGGLVPGGSLVASRRQWEGEWADPAEELSDQRVEAKSSQRTACGEADEEVAVAPQMRGGTPDCKRRAYRRADRREHRADRRPGHRAVLIRLFGHALDPIPRRGRGMRTRARSRARAKCAGYVVFPYRKEGFTRLIPAQGEPSLTV